MNNMSAIEMMAKIYTGHKRHEEVLSSPPQSSEEEGYDVYEESIEKEEEITEVAKRILSVSSEESEEELTASQKLEEAAKGIWMDSSSSEDTDDIEELIGSMTALKAAQEEQASVIYSLWEAFCWSLSVAATPAYYAAGLFSDFAIDGDHPYKQAKYRCVLREIIKQIPPDVKLIASKEDYKLSPLQKQLKKIILHLFRPAEEFAEGYREKHREFVRLIREAFSSDAYEVLDTRDYRTEQTLHAMAFSIYNVPLWSFLASVICGAIEKGYNSSEKLDDIMELSLEEQRQAIIDLPQAYKAPLAVLLFNKARGHFGLGFDPHTLGNLPHILFDLKFNDQKTRFIRTATPTIDIPNPEVSGSKTRMAPEFLAFLRHCRENDKKLFYFNLQAADGGTESHRSELLIKTFEEEDLQDSIFMLDHDTKWYSQTKVWEGANNAGEFKKEICNHLLNHKSFSIPLKYKCDPAFIDRLYDLVEEIHEDVFFSVGTLNKAKRQDFLDIAFSMFIFECMIFAKPDIIMTCCKDALDRAGVRIFILMYMMMLYTNQLDNDSKKQLMIATFAPAFLMKKQEIIEPRFKRLSRCHKRLSTKRVMENLIKRAEKRKIKNSIGIHMHHQEDQIFDWDSGAFCCELEELPE